MENFLSKLVLPNTIIQIGTYNHIAMSISNNICAKDLTALVNTRQNIYFLGGVNSKKGLLRAADQDVILKNYCYFDFDLRKESGYKISTEGVMKKIERIINKLDGDDRFCEYSYIIFTGNGLHILYLGDPITIHNKDDISCFKSGMQVLGCLLSDVIGHEYDSSCTNISRIMRLPGSWNQEKYINGKGDEVKGDYIQSKIIKSQPRNAKLFKEIMHLGKLKIDEESKKYKSIKHKHITHDSNIVLQSSVFEAINGYPIEELVCEYTGFRFDGTKNFYDENGGKAAFFKATNTMSGNDNFIVVSGSQHLQDDYDGYNPYLFVKAHYKLTPYQTIKFFTNKSNAIANLVSREKMKYIAKKEKDFFKILAKIKNNNTPL